MSRKEIRDSSFDQFADSYSQTLNASVALSGEDAEFFTRCKMEIICDTLRDRIPRSDLRFLDYGCGTGRAAFWLQKFFPQCSYTGVDPSAESIRHARESVSVPNAEFLTLEEARLQHSPHGLYSVAFSAVVFHHIPAGERAGAVALMKSLLEPGGSFFIFEHNPFNPLTRHIVRTCPFDKDAVLLRPGEARRLLAGSGFRNITTRYYFFFPRILQVLRPLERMLSWNPLGAQYVAVGWNL